MAKIKRCCGSCGGDNVSVDAFAQWDTDNQRWELSATFDYSFCEDCDRQTTIIDVELED